MKQKKTLKDLTLLDRFLFAEAMEDPENMRTVLEIILGKEVVLKYLPQAEKEKRTSPYYRFVKLDVWAQDMQDAVYDTEVQGEDTGNLPKRSRYYQSMIDSKLMEPGEIDFNKLNQVFIIVIAPFDLFGQKRYKYTFKMSCEEVPGLQLEDGAVRIFLNTRGENPEEVSPELVELLRYIEHTDKETGQNCKSERVRQMHKRIEVIKSSEEVSVRYMQEWEERELERKEAREEGKEGIIGTWILNNWRSGKSEEQIIQELIKWFGLSQEEACNYARKFLMEAESKDR